MVGNLSLRTVIIEPLLKPRTNPRRLPVQTAAFNGNPYHPARNLLSLEPFQEYSNFRVHCLFILSWSFDLQQCFKHRPPLHLYPTSARSRSSDEMTDIIGLVPNRKPRAFPAHAGVCLCCWFSIHRWDTSSCHGDPLLRDWVMLQLFLPVHLVRVPRSGAGGSKVSMFDWKPLQRAFPVYSITKSDLFCILVIIWYCQILI